METSLEELMKKEKRYTSLIELYSEDIVNKNNLEKSIATYKKYVELLECSREEAYNINFSELLYTSESMEEEKNRLNMIVSLINERVKQRKKLKKEYVKLLKSKDKEYNSFWEELEEKNPIHNISNLDEYNNRLYLISEYEKRVTKKSNLERENNENSIKLEEALSNLKVDKSTNNKFEEELEENFLENFKVTDYVTIDFNKEIELDLIETIIKENLNVEQHNLKELNAKSKKNPKDKEVKELLRIKREQIKKIKEEHFKIKEIIYIVSILSLLKNKNTDFYEMKNKRESIISILNDRETLVNKYSLKLEEENFKNLKILVQKQLETVNAQEKNNHIIEMTKESVSSNNQKIEEIDTLNSEKEYKDLIEEFPILVQKEEKNNQQIDVIEKEENNNEIDTNLWNLLHNSKETNEDINPLLISDEETLNKENIVNYKDFVIDKSGISAFNHEEKEEKNNTQFSESIKLEDYVESPIIDKSNEENIQESSTKEIDLNNYIVMPNENNIIEEKEDNANEPISKEEHIESNINRYDGSEKKILEENDITESIINYNDNSSTNILEKNKDNSDEIDGVDALAARVTAQDKTDNDSKDDIFATLVSVDALPNTINSHDITSKSRGILSKVMQKMGISEEQTNVKRRIIQ